MTICTRSGIEFAPWAPRVEDVRIEDIAHGLSHMPRFAGHTKTFYSVAQHSCIVAELVLERDVQHAFKGLLHDASEAYLMDMPSPIKQLIPVYVEAEDRLMRAIYRHFGLLEDPLKPDIVEWADKEALHWERRDLMPCASWWEKLELPTRGELVALPPAAAKARFLELFDRLQPMPVAD